MKRPRNESTDEGMKPENLGSRPASSRRVPTSLSPRQSEILDLVASGRTSKEIAAVLGIAESTVNWHLSNAFARLGAGSRAEAVALAMNREPLREPRPLVAPVLHGQRALAPIAIAVILAMLLGGAIASAAILQPRLEWSPPETPAPTERGGVIDDTSSAGADVIGPRDVGAAPGAAALEAASPAADPPARAPSAPSRNVHGRTPTPTSSMTAAATHVPSGLMTVPAAPIPTVPPSALPSVPLPALTTVVIGR